MGWETDGTEYGYSSNVNGPWVSLEGTSLVHCFGARVAVAQGRGYLTYAARYSDDQPYSYMMLYIHSPLGPGTAAELNGGWSVIYHDVGTSPDIA